MPDGPPVKRPVGMEEVWTVTIEAKAPISVWWACVNSGAGPDNRIPPVDIYISAVVNIDIGIPPSTIVDIYPVV